MAQIDSLFNILIERNGSDLHLEEGQKPKIRLQGDLTVISEDILSKEKLNALLCEIAAPEEWRTFESTGDLDFAYSYQQSRLRANYFRHFYGLGGIFRLIPSKILTIEELDLPPRIKDFTKWKSGIILVTGPTGSGKSTTLAAIIDYINTNKVLKIITIEEPVEFIHSKKKSLITHREVGKDGRGA